MAKKWSIASIKFPRNRPKNQAIIFARNLGINEAADPELYYYVIKWYVETNTGDEFPISENEYDEFEEDSLEGDFGKIHDKVLKEIEAYQKEQKKNKKPTASKRPPKAPTKKSPTRQRQRKSTANKNQNPISEVSSSTNVDTQNKETCCEDIKDKIEDLLGEIKRGAIQLQKKEPGPRTRPTSRSASTFVSPSNFRTRNVRIARTTLERSRAVIDNGGGGGNNGRVGGGGGGGGSNDPMVQILLKIQKSVDNILAVLSAQRATTIKTQRVERITQEQNKRKEAENQLESSAKKTYDSFQKVMSPVKGILDRIFDFIFYTLLGKAFTELVKWISDPKNKKKIESLKRFFKDWWPAILGTFILFGTRFGKFIRSTVGLAINLTKYIRAIGIPGILKLLKTFGVRSLYAGAAVAAAYGGYQLLKPKNESEKIKQPKPQQQSSPEEKKIKPQPLPPSYAFNRGGIIPQRNSTPIEKIALDGSQQITSNSGLDITGAGPDTQLVAARPGEIVVTPEDAKDIQNKTGLNLYQFVAGRKPKYANNIQMAKDGGIVGGGKLSAADYNSLLAISALEDDTAQGRADVAQSIYNRLQAANNYGANFYQKKDTIKDIIIAKDQYQPVFGNISDWKNIVDRKTAALAVMNSTKGKKYNWNMQEALRQMSDTEKALKNIKLQQQAQNFIGTRTAFRGKSEQPYMRPDKGDILRNKDSNFFIHEGNYGNKPAPIPAQFQAPPPPKPKPKPQGFLEPLWNNILRFTGLKTSDASLAPVTPNVRQPGKRVQGKGNFTITELPPVMVSSNQNIAPGAKNGSQVPALSPIPPNREEREITLSAYGLT